MSPLNGSSKGFWSDDLGTHLFFTVRPNLVRTSFRIHGCMAEIVLHLETKSSSSLFSVQKVRGYGKITILTGRGKRKKGNSVDPFPEKS
jgi:hypothetical protein